MKFAVLDIETSNLNADFGFIICATVKTYGQDDMVTFRIDDYKLWQKDKWNDKQLVKELAQYLDQYDGVITYFGKNFDIPFITSQIAGYGFRPLKALFHIDVFYITRYRMKLHNAKLNTLITFLNTYRRGKKSIEEKTAINSINYKKAITGDKAGVDYIVKHCEKDVIALEQCYELMKDQVAGIKKGY